MFFVNREIDLDGNFYSDKVKCRIMLTTAIFSIVFYVILYLFVSCIAQKTTNERRTTTKEPSTTELNDSIFSDPLIFCKLQPVNYDCDKSGQRRPYYYYDIKMEDCKSSVFGNCLQNLNKFVSLSDCHNTCRHIGKEPIDYTIRKEVFCRLQPDFGECNTYYPMWYFDMSTRTCRGFSYSGCGGNLNRFPTSQMCSKVCRGIVGY